MLVYQRVNQEPATEVEEYVGMLGNEKRAWLISPFGNSWSISIQPLQRMDETNTRRLPQCHAQDRRTGCKTAREERAITGCHCAVELLSCTISCTISCTHHHLDQYRGDHLQRVGHLVPQLEQSLQHLEDQTLQALEALNPVGFGQ